MAAFTFAVDSRLFGDPLKRMLSRPPWCTPLRSKDEEGTGRVSTAKTFIYRRTPLADDAYASTSAKMLTFAWSKSRSSGSRHRWRMSDQMAAMAREFV